jgi:hypothetical protein
MGQGRKCCRGSEPDPPRSGRLILGCALGNVEGRGNLAAIVPRRSANEMSFLNLPSRTSTSAGRPKGRACACTRPHVHVPVPCLQVAPSSFVIACARQYCSLASELACAPQMSFYFVRAALGAVVSEQAGIAEPEVMILQPTPAQRVGVFRALERDARRELRRARAVQSCTAPESPAEASTSSPDTPERPAPSETPRRQARTRWRRRAPAPG